MADRVVGEGQLFVGTYDAGPNSPQTTLELLDKLDSFDGKGSIGEFSETFIKFVNEYDGKDFYNDLALGIYFFEDFLTNKRQLEEAWLLLENENISISNVFEAVAHKLPQDWNGDAQNQLFWSIYSLLRNNPEVTKNSSCILESIIKFDKTHQVEAIFKLVEQSTIEDGISLINDFIELQPDRASENIWETIDLLINIEEKNHEFGQYNTFTDDELVKIRKLFGNIKDWIPSLNSSYKIDELVFSYCRLINIYPKLLIHSNELFITLLEQDSRHLNKLIDVAGNYYGYYGFEDLVKLYTHFLNKNQSTHATNNILNTVNKLKNVTYDKKSDSNFKPEELEAMKRFFESLNGQLSRIYETGEIKDLTISIYNLLSNRRPLINYAQDTVRELIRTYDPDNQFLDNLVGDYYNPLQALNLYNSLLESYKDNNIEDNKIFRIIRALNKVYIKNVDENGVLIKFTIEEIKALDKFNSYLVKYLPNINGDIFDLDTEQYIDCILSKSVEINSDTLELLLLYLNHGSNLELNGKILNVIADKLTIEEASKYFSIFFNQNHTPKTTSQIDDFIYTYYQIISRQKSSDGNSLVFTPQEETSISAFFESLNQILPSIKQNHHFRYFKAAYTHLLSKHPELERYQGVISENIQMHPVKDRISKIQRNHIFPKLSPFVFGLGRGSELLSESVGLERLDFIVQAFNTLDKSQRYKLLLALDKYTQGEEGLMRRRLLKTLLTSKSSSEITADDILTENNLNSAHLAEILSNDTIFDLIRIMAENPREYVFPLGLFLSQIPLNNLPYELIKKINPVLSEVECVIKLKEKDWSLCTLSEERMLSSMKENSVLIVNECLMLKFHGKLSAFCYKTTKLKNGQTLFAGCWYSPTDKEIRSLLKQRFINGELVLNGIGGNWAMMRSINKKGKFSPDDVWIKVREYLARVPSASEVERLKRMSIVDKLEDGYLKGN